MAPTLVHRTGSYTFWCALNYANITKSIKRVIISPNVSNLLTLASSKQSRWSRCTGNPITENKFSFTHFVSSEQSQWSRCTGHPLSENKHQISRKTLNESWPFQKWARLIILTEDKIYGKTSLHHTHNRKTFNEQHKFLYGGNIPHFLRG